MKNIIMEDAENLPESLQFFTYEEVARILKVKRATVRSWVYRGEIRTTLSMGKKSLVPKSELQRFVAKKTRILERKVFPLRVEQRKSVEPIADDGATEPGQVNNEVNQTPPQN